MIEGSGPMIDLISPKGKSNALISETSQCDSFRSDRESPGARFVENLWLLFEALPIDPCVYLFIHRKPIPILELFDRR